jgi:hypothetical protein
LPQISTSKKHAKKKNNKKKRDRKKARKIRQQAKARRDEPVPFGSRAQAAVRNRAAVPALLMNRGEEGARSLPETPSTT